ncbi:MAG TPA: hypothetical protein PLY87_01860 [Planctomycetaceae bacterium]|nr:hypothetical protein [Planctomycetaceae bacterium]
MTRLSEQWTKKKLVAHCASEETWYFSAASYWKQRYALIMIDVDCKKRGTPEGARAFLEFLAANYFPGMYIEVSTNGNGGHGYLLIDKYNLEGQSVNDILLHRLCPWLNMMSQKFDVEFIEVKGTLSIVEWGLTGMCCATLLVVLPKFLVDCSITLMRSEKFQLSSFVI